MSATTPCGCAGGRGIRRRPLPRPAIEQAERRAVAADRRQRDVRRHRLRHRQAEPPPVLGQVGDAEAHRVGRAADRTTRPSTTIVPLSAGAIPKRARPTSVRPAPTRPAKPTTSPACTSKFTSSNVPARPEPLDAQDGLAGLVPGAHEEVAEVTPDHLADEPIREVSAAGRVEMCRPSRNTVMRSAMRNTSSSRWLMNSTATPRRRSSPTWSNSRSTSCADSDAVGSSMISTRASSEIALAISTACCAATASVLAGARGSTSMASDRRMASASSYIRRQRTSRPRLRCPMKMFSATVRSG